MFKKDIYFKKEYAELYVESSDNEVIEYIFDNIRGTIKYLFVKRKIECSINNEIYYDIITPYGYGGPIVNLKKSTEYDSLVASFNREFEIYCEENNIVSEFIRFHPLINNQKWFTGVYDISFNRNTIFIDLESEDVVWNNMKSTSRNRIRKAIKKEMYVVEDSSQQNINNFMKLYYMTMDKKSANDSYYFKKKYFDSLMNITNSCKIFNVIYKNEIIASMIVLIGEEYIHYHLGATNSDFYSLSPNNILFYEVSKWAIKNNYKKFHLGGGYGGPNDNLFRFKKTLNKNGLASFYIGKKILNKDFYDELTNKRLEAGKIDKNFFPEYRSPIVE